MTFFYRQKGDFSVTLCPSDNFRRIKMYHGHNSTGWEGIIRPQP